MATTDQKLVSSTLTGDTRAFGELVERYSGLVHGVVLEVVRRPEEVEDLVQEIFCKAYEQLPALRRPSRFAPWLGSIARHQVLHWLRQRSARSRTETEFEKVIPFSPLPLPDEDLETSERDHLLWSALDSLDPERRRLLVLYHLEGCTLKEIARFFNKPLTTVRWRLLQSERKLGQQFSALLNQSPVHLPARKGELARQVLSLLPPTLYLATDANAVPWWDIRTWLQTTRQEITASLTGSALLHVAGLGLFGLFGSGSDSSTTVRLQAQVGPELAVERLSGRIPILPPAELLEQLPAPPDPPEAPEHIVDTEKYTAFTIPDSLKPELRSITEEKPPPPPAIPPLNFPEEARSIPDDLQQAATSDSDQLDLLRLRDMSRADQKRSVAIADEDAPGGLYGYVNFTPLALAGAGSAGPQLYNLARFMREYTSIHARVRPRSPHRQFTSRALLEDPVHFLLQGLPRPRADSSRVAEEHRHPFGRGAPYLPDHLTDLSPTELHLLGDYLRGGGLLYIEGGPPYLGEMFAHLRRAFDDSVHIVRLPASHPVYHAYYHFESGFPGEHKESDSTFVLPRGYPLGLWGVEVDGEVAAIFSDLPLFGSLHLPANYFKEAVARSRPPLNALANIVAYGLTRSRGMTARKPLPLWARLNSTHP